MAPDQRDLMVFHQVALLGSFTKAAENQNVSKGYISKAVRRLEEQLGKKLFQRTTRHLVLTTAGEQLLTTTTAMNEVLQKGLSELQALGGEPRGQLRIAAPPAFGVSVLAPLIAEFQQQYPHVSLQMELDSKLVDIIAGGYDVVFRSAKLDDSSLIARSIGRFASAIVATPKFVKENHLSKVNSPDELEGVACLAYRGSKAWHFELEGVIKDIAINPIVTSNLLSFLKVSVLNHMGVGLFPYFMVEKEIKEKKLLTILPRWSSVKSPLYLVYPSRDYIPMKAKCFIDFVTQRLS